MEVIIDSKLHLNFKNKLDHRLTMDVVYKALTYTNPEYNKAKNKKDITENIINFETKGPSIIIPKGSKHIIKNLMSLGIKIEKIIDNRSEGYDIEFKHKYDPRDQEQVNAIEGYMKATKNGGGAIIHAICGFGKTFCALKLIEKIKKSTLILVDENLLLEQWIEAIEDDCIFDMDKLGIIGMNQEIYLDKDVIIASKDTLVNRPEIMEWLKSNIGFVIVDEAHVASANVFQEVLKNLSPKYILGLTATPNRSDGESYLMFDEIGKICFSASREFLIKQGSVMLPWLRARFVKRNNSFPKEFVKWKEDVVKQMKEVKPDEAGEYKWKTKKYTERGFKSTITRFSKSSMDWAYLTTQALEKDLETIKEISKLIKFHYDNGDQSICICQKVAFSKNYKKMLIELGVPEEHIGVVLGETKKKERKEIIAKAKSGEIRILLTSKILDKGISVNNANVLFLLYPSKNASTLEQRVGRVSRTAKNKRYAIVYDFIYDDKIFFNQFYRKYKPCIKKEGEFCLSRGECETTPDVCEEILEIEYRLKVYRECTKLHNSLEILIPMLSSYFKGSQPHQSFIDEYKFNLDNLTNSEIGKKFIITI